MSLESKFGSHWQTALVWILFLGSVGTLFVNSVTAFLLPQQESAIRETLSQAGTELAHLAQSDADTLETYVPSQMAVLNERLERLSQQVLTDRMGVEGGFYLDGDWDEFVGYAFPTEQHRGPRHEMRRDPPPKEEPYIRLQAKQSAVQSDPQPTLQTRDVGPSRVVVATVPVGTVRPARLVVWLMYRLTGPEQHGRELFRYRISTFLALGGVATALLLTLKLRHTLRMERDSRERLRDELRKSEHLASLGLMVAQVAHELRNPLAGIRSTVQLWQRMPDRALTPESMDAVVNAVDRMNTLLTNLLNFSRSEVQSRSPVDLNKAVVETLQLLAVQAAQQRVAIELNLDPSLPILDASDAGLRQVVLNLTTNALQAMPHAGHLNCRTSYNSAEQTVMLEILDTGVGIDAATRSRLFEPFFTTRAQGTGLGLALCRDIVLQHGGQISLEPASPRGTLCRVVLPARDRSASTSEGSAPKVDA